MADTDVVENARFSGCAGHFPFRDPTQEGRRLWVGNLPRIEPQAAVEVEMRHLFGGFVVESVSTIVRPPPRRPSASHQADYGYCFVDLRTKYAAELAARTLHNTTARWGGLVRVRLAYDDRRKAERPDKLHDRRS
jgi:hypothetical protein